MALSEHYLGFSHLVPLGLSSDICGVRSFFLWMILAFLLGDAAWWWRADRYLKSWPVRAGKHSKGGSDQADGMIAVSRAALCGFMALVMGGLLGLIGMRMSGAFPESAYPSALFALVYVWHLLVLPPVLFGWAMVVACRGGFSLLRTLREVRSRFCKPGASYNVFHVSESGRLAALGEFQNVSEEGRLLGNRREFLSAALTLAPAGLAIGVTERGLMGLEEFRVRRLEAKVPRLPGALDGFRIALVSDLHVGRFTHGRILEKIVEVTNGLKADLIAFTGDLVNYSLEDLPSGLELLAAFKAKHGVFAVEGNHDLLMDPTRFRRETSRVVPLLVNERAELEVLGHRLELLGLGWGGDLDRLLSRRKRLNVGEQDPDTQRAEESPDRHHFRMLLAHHPHVFDEAEGVDLTLSGHTHGGQLMLSDRLGVGPMMFRYWSGLYQRANRSLVVSNGVGNWFPVRMRAPAEVVEVVLRSPES